MRMGPVNWGSSDDRPFLILHGERDTLVPVGQSPIVREKRPRARSRAGGVFAELVIVKSAELLRVIADFFDRRRWDFGMGAELCRIGARVDSSYRFCYRRFQP